ncbi:MULTISPECIES: PKD domain-containing protein [unclassified Rhodanobacter]|uniref:PKD domain-containing protein n=1 Tax=unclassified Rhodanobacter TaxID=2621553 RepID=UPI001BE041F1|nr:MULTISPECIES: PKD domain-containing protein [unclassified Rhodanobacter]MBT2145450.1 PKD domain-containing protein [Rhodanobacter sp. LX-99]MBT2149495.1 PKD domain-containing protein [Rhodanobacter sp. LX-100]
MTTNWNHLLKRIAIAVGKGLWRMAVLLFALLTAIGTFTVRRLLPALWQGWRNTVWPLLRRGYLKLPRRRLVVGMAGLLLVATCVLLLRSPGNGKANLSARTSTAAVDTMPGKPAVLTFAPASAAPGAPVLLSGVPVVADERLDVRVGGQPAAAQRLADGSIRILVPLYLGPDNWPVPPAQPQPVEVHRGGVLAAASKSGLRVTELQRAPGTTAGVQRSLATITGAYESILTSLPVQREEDRAYRQATLATLRALVSEGDHSLAAVLAGTSPLLAGAEVDLELTDALLASSGGAAYLDAYATALAGKPSADGDASASPATAQGPHRRAGLNVLAVAAKAAGNSMAATLQASDLGFQPRSFSASTSAAAYTGDLLKSAGLLTAAWAADSALAGGSAFATMGLGTDGDGGGSHYVVSGGGVARCRGGDDKAFEIACLMQVQGVLSAFTLEVVKPTAELYANTLGLAFGAAGVAGKAIPGHTMVSALLTITSFVMEKVSLSLLPAELSRFEIVEHKGLMRVGEIAKVTIEVEARNHPQTVTVMDLVDLTKMVVGPNIKFNQAYKDALVSVFDYTIDIYQAALRGSEYMQRGSTAGVNPGAFTMPAMKWGPAKITSDDLVTLFSQDKQVVEPQEKALVWEAKGYGKTGVRAETRGAGDRSKVLVDHSMCPGCVWNGGAFGEDILVESKKIDVGVKLEPLPRHGTAPMEVELTWEIAEELEDKGPLACTVDFGDGSPVEHIGDCRKTDSVSHEYPYTSRLNADTDGAYVATISLGGSRPDGSTEIYPDWEFKVSPSGGEAPLDTKFTWNIPLPPDRTAPSCVLDHGDGSSQQTFDDCTRATKAGHRYEKRGSYVATLTMASDGAKDTKTAPVSVAETGTCTNLLEGKTWTGSVSYNQSRDVYDDRGRHAVYNFAVSLSADMPEDTRRQWRGGDYLVRYFSPNPSGTANITYTEEDYDERGALTMYDRFTGNGKLRPFEKGMSEDGTMLILTLRRDCTYSFYLQGQVYGSGERWAVIGDKESYEGRLWLHSVTGEGQVTSSSQIQGSAQFPSLIRSQIEDNSFEKTSWISEMNIVGDALGEAEMGTVTVHWDFRPKD